MKKTLIIIIIAIIIIAIAGVVAVNFLIIKKSPEPVTPTVISEEEAAKTKEEKQEKQIVTKLTEEEEIFEKAGDLPLPAHPDAQLVNSEIKTILTEIFNGAKRAGGWFDIDPQIDFNLDYKVKRKITTDDYNLLKTAFANNGYTIESSGISGKEISVEARKNLGEERTLSLDLSCTIDTQDVEIRGEITTISE